MSTQIRPGCAATENSPQHMPHHMQHSPRDNTWDRKVPNTVTLKLPQKLALLQGKTTTNYYKLFCKINTSCIKKCKEKILEFL
jgi:hypothetical protein